jgi:hypothetical protein
VDLLREDLAAAGVPYCVEGPNGKEYADFHALRHTFCSALAAAGTGPKELQTLARHSDVRLTLGTYTHTGTAALAKAVGRLQMPGEAPKSPLACMTREQLEGAVLGLVILLRSLLPPVTPGAGPGSAVVAPRVAPRMGISGDVGEHLGTIKTRRT